MKKIPLLVFIMIANLLVIAQTPEQQATDLLKKMTLEEKIGQMTQVTFAVIAKGGWGDTEGNIDPAALKKAIQE